MTMQSLILLKGVDHFNFKIGITMGAANPSVLFAALFVNGIKGQVIWLLHKDTQSSNL
ncbi:MAG: hypothetical protein H0V82_02600 [Candidatus Protochlamydia sp.]|nr:hypothetical protein [Candidatus Protochlamydia sp.]